MQGLLFDVTFMVALGAGVTLGYLGANIYQRQLLKDLVRSTIQSIFTGRGKL